MPEAVLGPTGQRKVLGAELKRLRDTAGLRLEDVAAELGCSRSKVSRIENGMGLARVIELRAMLDQYGVTDEQDRARLLGALGKATEEGWWEQTEYDQVLPAGLGVYVGLENEVGQLQTWEVNWVPGLLQTEDYMRAVLSEARSEQASEVDALMAVRKKRQARLDGPDCLELWAIIDESVLLRPVGNVDIMRAQVAHLLAQAERPNVTLQVLPLAKGMHPGLRGPFSILSFGLDEVTIYVDSPSGNVLLNREKQVAAFAHMFNRLTALALDPQETAARLRAAC
ncbi:helix-turn-helix domain-containing protein [Embleya sp. AB8]|uniref:helix-turn-helix domain-containing protein n=1 Tax=Embleya sp. AB8 TaxID=3156304 RepID=UPI003C7502C2